MSDDTYPPRDAAEARANAFAERLAHALAADERDAIQQKHLVALARGHRGFALNSLRGVLQLALRDEPDWQGLVGLSSAFTALHSRRWRRRENACLTRRGLTLRGR